MSYKHHQMQWVKLQWEGFELANWESPNNECKGLKGIDSSLFRWKEQIPRCGEWLPWGAGLPPEKHLEEYGLGWGDSLEPTLPPPDLRAHSHHLSHLEA